MKKMIKYIAAYIVVLAFMYLMLSFYSWDVNAGNWSKEVRLLFCFLSFVSVLYFILYDINLNELL